MKEQVTSLFLWHVCIYLQKSKERNNKCMLQTFIASRKSNCFRSSVETQNCSTNIMSVQHETLVIFNDWMSAFVGSRCLRIRHQIHWNHSLFLEAVLKLAKFDCSLGAVNIWNNRTQGKKKINNCFLFALCLTFITFVVEKPFQLQKET